MRAKKFFSYFKWDLDCSYLLSELIIVLFSIFTAKKKQSLKKKKVNVLKKKSESPCQFFKEFFKQFFTSFETTA